MTRFDFPKDFLWGSAVASFQVEGGIDNCDWAVAAKHGKVPPAGKACDFKTTYESDLDRAKDMGQNAFRFSIEWARIEPEEGKWDNDAIRYYLDLIEAIKKRGMVPFVTLWHFTLPTWFAEKGAFEKKDNIFYFVRYTLHVLSLIHEQVTFVASMNEPMVYTSNSYIRGNWPPFQKTIFKHWKVLKNLATAHNLLYLRAKEKYPNLSIGFAKNNIWFHATNIFGVIPANLLRWFWNERFINWTMGKVDHIGLNYYFHKAFGSYDKLPKNDFGWDICPQGLYETIMELVSLNVPIYITENGTADAKDEHRSAFIEQHVKEVGRAIVSGAPVKGYFFWSLLDNYEWAAGYTKRFGLIEVNFETGERKARGSVETYARIIKSGFVE